MTQVRTLLEMRFKLISPARGTVAERNIICDENKIARSLSRWLDTEAIEILPGDCILIDRCKTT